MKNVLILSSPDVGLNAGHGPIEIRNTLQKYGLNVVLITKYKPVSSKDDSIQYYYGAWEAMLRGVFRRIRHRVLRFITKNLTMDYFLRDLLSFFPLKSTRKLKKIAGFTPDAIVVFFMPEFLNYLDLYRFHKKYGCKIFVGTVDMYPFTGVCHYSQGCDKYTQNCGRCPIINSKYTYDISWLMLKIKKYVSKRIDLYGFTWTSEFESLLKTSSVYRDLPIVRVPLFITQLPNMHSPSISQKFDIKNKYGICEEDYVVLVCAAGLNSVTKGMYDIVEAIDIVLHLDEKQKKNLVLVTAGRGELPHDPAVKRIVKLGHLSHDELYKAYWLSDLYISASKEDVGPGTLAYAFLCGVPAVSYNTGIAPTLIKDKENGFLIEKNDIDDLAQKIIEFFNLNIEERNEWSYDISVSSKSFFDESWAQNLVEAING